MLWLHEFLCVYTTTSSELQGVRNACVVMVLSVVLAQCLRGHERDTDVIIAAQQGTHIL